MLKSRILIALLVLLLPALAVADSQFIEGNFGNVAMNKAADLDAMMNGLMADHFKAAGQFEAVQVTDTHIRFNQKLNGLPVWGAQMVLGIDARGNITRINGEFGQDTGSVIAKLNAADALALALGKAGLQGEATDADLAYVLVDGNAVLAWTSEIQYVDAAGNFQRDRVFAAAGTGEMVARHPQVHYALSALTYSCNNTSCGTLVQNCASYGCSNTGDSAVDAAHNYAIATYIYFDNEHGRDSLDDNGMTLRSRVHYGNNYNNAFWDGSQMTYGDGDGVTFKPLSEDADVVAHELTHGVTSNSSNLIYQNESGALNEAMSDIFGALVDRQEGATGSDIWDVGEDIYTPGTPGDGGIRDMACPSCAGDYDYYPTRYVGSSDNGGVHWNSGIANLAFKLLVTGGTHPTGATSVNVPAIGFDAAADIFYAANNSCLTASSNFEAARNCTAAAAGANAAAVQDAWDAVGVPGGSAPPPPPPPPNGGSCSAGYTHYVGTATAGQGDLTTANYNASGAQHGELFCSGADLDLYLDRMRSNGSFRSTVASSTSAGCNEEINYSNNRNRTYRWRVSPYSGSASFDLCVNPG